MGKTYWDLEGSGLILIEARNCSEFSKLRFFHLYKTLPIDLKAGGFDLYSIISGGIESAP